MPNYYRASNPSDLRNLPQEWIGALIANNNPKKDEWILAPDRPSENHYWSNGQWVEILAATTNDEADAVQFIPPSVPENL